VSEIIIQNLISPVVLFFLLGIIAATFKSDLQFPKGLTEALSMYLLIAIGIKGGIELSHYHLEAVVGPVIGTIFLGMLIPVIVLMITRLFMKVDLKNSIALAATYGSTSIVTYGAAVSFLEKSGTTYEGFMNAMVVLKESPAILVSLLLLSIIERQQAVPTTLSSKRVGIISGGLIDKEVLKESFFGKSIILLLGSLIIGLVVGERAIPMVQPLFIDLYQSILILFLLYMGLTVGERLPEVRKHGIKLILFGVLTPILLGALGVLVGTLVGLSVGGATLMGILAGSASYIAAPAALRTSVPEANPSIYLGLSLGVTFPFNLIFGIPLYFEFAKLLH
jgi:hypothetical protein